MDDGVCDSIVSTTIKAIIATPFLSETIDDHQYLLFQLRTISGLPRIGFYLINTPLPEVRA